MLETLVREALKACRKNPLKRLEWAVDFSQGTIVTPMSEAGLTCFLWAQGIQDRPGMSVPAQVKALMTDSHLAKLTYRGEEVKWARQAFRKILTAAASDREIELPLRHVTAKFTRAGGLELESNISSKDQGEAKREAIAFRLIRLLEKKIVTSTRKSVRLTPVRLYVGICPKDGDGCGTLFAKGRIDQQYCSRTCVSRAQVYRRRRKLRDKKKLKKSLG